MQKGLIALLGVVFLLIGAYYFISDKNNKNPGDQTPQAQTPQVAQTFNGILPCADCSGLDTTLLLSPDSTYKLTEIYQGKNDDEPFITDGTWKNETGTPSNPDQEVLVLTASNGNQTFYAWTNENTLTSLDQEKNSIDAPFNLSLTKQK